LKSLNDLREPLPATLNLREVTLFHLSSPQWFGEDVDGFDGIRDRAIDADATNRQHDMGGVADE
jgi:hypothetical protein